MKIPRPLLFLECQKGAIIIMLALLLGPLITMIALALDISRGFELKQREVNAASAAALAASVQNGSVSEAQIYFASNLPNGQGNVSYKLSDVVINVAGGEIAVTPTNFRLPVNFPVGAPPVVKAPLRVSATSVASLSTGRMQPINFGFILDKSYSMVPPNSPLTASPIAGHPPVTQLVALTQSYQIIIEDIMATPDAENNFSVGTTAYATRIAPDDSFDFTNDFNYAINYTVSNILNDTGHADGPQEGGTCGACGLKKMRTELLPSAPPDRLDVVIFMTDGEMTVPCPSNGYFGASCLTIPYTENSLPNPLPAGLPVFYSNPADPIYNYTLAHVAAAAECALLKASRPKISIWTIGFGQYSNNGDNYTLLEFCASNPQQHLYAANGQQLGEIFRKIWSVSGKVRLTK